jgi:hypothetical protein
MPHRCCKPIVLKPAQDAARPLPASLAHRDARRRERSQPIPRVHLFGSSAWPLGACSTRLTSARFDISQPIALRVLEHMGAMVRSSVSFRRIASISVGRTSLRSAPRRIRHTRIADDVQADLRETTPGKPNIGSAKIDVPQNPHFSPVSHVISRSAARG